MNLKIYYELQNKWLMNNSAHRCNSTSSSECDGSTSVCSGGSQPYRISDVGQNDESFMQAATEAVNEFYESNQSPVLFTQLHGFNKDSRPADFPHVIASYGIRVLPPDHRDEGQVIETIIEDLCDCKVSLYHNDMEINELGGTTNKQGRYLNSSTDPCHQAGLVNSGKFLHIEQSPYIRDNYDFVLQALASVSSEIVIPPPALGIDDISESTIYPNPASDEINLVNTLGYERIEIFNTLGQRVISQSIVGLDQEISISVSQLTNGIYILQLSDHSGSTTAHKFVKE